MEGIFCGYCDEEMDQDVPAQPNLSEAISFFKDFIWENKKSESIMKVLFFQVPDDATLQISKSEENKWCVSAKASNRRRFLGPFFKQDTFNIFIDKNEMETVNLIRLFYQNSLYEFTTYLKNSD